MNRIGTILVGALLALILAASTLFVVDQRQFAVVYALGEIKEVISEPGLKVKMPAPLQNVVFLDRRIQTLDSPESRPIFTAEKKSLVIDWLVKWRITEPRQFIRNNGVDIRNAENRLSPIVQAALNEEVTKRTVGAMLSAEREKVMQGVIRRLADDAKSGGAEGEKIRADADRQREIIVAEAYRDAQKIKGEGDAKASALYAEAFGKDPQFAQFYRSLEAYRASFRNKSDVMVIDQNSEFFKAMRGAGAGAAR